MSLRLLRCSVALLCALACGAAAAAVPTSERDALVALYNSTGGAQWKNNSGWNGAPGTECDTWFGVHCDEAGSTVIDIELGDNNLSGTLPPFGGLPNLQTFVVYTNHLSGAIPALTGLKQLVFLDLNSNQFSGPLPSLSGVSSLVYLDVDSNQLSGPLPGFAGLNKLQYFDGHSNQFSNSIPSLQGLSALQVIDLSSNRLSGNVPAVSNLPALQRFDFGDNQLNGPIPDLSGLPSLQGFSLAQNQLSGHIPSFASLPASVSFIRLSYNNLDGPIPALSNLTSLAYFDANYNALDGSLPSLSGLTALTGFAVTGNKLLGPVPSLTGLTKLEQFAIDNNQLSGPLPSLSGLTALQGFYAGNNALTQNVPALTGLVNLRSFFVDSNQLSGGVSSLSGLTQLQYFGVSDNKLSGPLPSLAGLTNLIYLDASYNQFDGSVPDLTGLVNLQTLYLGFNRLSGSVPSLAGLTALQTIAVDDNQLDGSITPPFTGLANLQVFLASNNRLTGSLPALTGLSALTDFDVSMNKLTGTLPLLAGLTNLEQFNASYNSIGGTLPPLTGLGKLQEFFVGFNQLDGAIPPLQGLTNLRYFAVDDNQLDGNLPTLTGLNNLIVFLAASNTIEGPMPSLSGLSNLELFEIGNNRVSGALAAVPAPINNLLPGLSSLCPNNLAPTTNAGWDNATGEAPWYSTCSSNESQEAHGAATTKDSTQIAFSGDGSVEVFQSMQTDLTGSSANAGGQDIYSFGADGETLLESIDSTGTKMIGTASLPAVSPDGKAIAFLFTPAAKDKKDFVTGQIWAGARGQPKHQVDVGMGGVPANGSAATTPTLSSANGTTQLAFCSAASNLVPNDANGGRDIFLVDPLNSASAPQRISVDGTGKELPGDSCEPKLSSDGGKLVFSVAAAPLFGTPARQIVLKDLGGKVLITGNFQPITTNASGQGAGADSSEPVLNSDGSVIAFTSAANLDGIGTPVGGREVFVSLKQPGGRVLKRARGGDGTVPDGASQHPQISDDGTALVMQTAAKNFLKSKASGKAASDPGAQCGAVTISTNFFSVNALGGSLCSSDGKTLNQSPSISGDGGTTGFDSNASQGNGSTNRNAFAQGVGMPSGITPLPANFSGDYSGQWFDPSQNGQGLVIDVLNPDANNNRIVLMTWFVFQGGKPTWMQGAGIARAGSGSAQNTVVVQMDQVAIYQGKSFPLGEAHADASLWGSVTLTFTDANTGKMSWRSSFPGFSSGSMPIRHFIAVSLPANDSASAQVRSCYSGNWFNPAQAGHGFEFEVLPFNPPYLAVDWFAFAPDGSPVWLQGVGQIQGNQAQMDLQLIDGVGAQFPPNYNPGAIVQHDWGSATFTFSDAAHATVTWSSVIPGYGTGQQPLQPIATGLMDRRGCQ